MNYSSSMNSFIHFHYNLGLLSFGAFVVGLLSAGRLSVSRLRWEMLQTYSKNHNLQIDTNKLNAVSVCVKCDQIH